MPCTNIPDGLLMPDGKFTIDFTFEFTFEMTFRFSKSLRRDFGTKFNSVVSFSSFLTAPCSITLKVPVYSPCALWQSFETRVVFRIDHCRIDHCPNLNPFLFVLWLETSYLVRRSAGFRGRRYVRKMIFRSDCILRVLYASHCLYGV